MYCGSEDQVKQAQAEIELMRKLLHPNIVTLIDSKLSRNAPTSPSRGKGSTSVATAWILMPYYGLGTVWDVVHERLAAHSPLLPLEILTILEQVRQSRAVILFR